MRRFLERGKRHATNLPGKRIGRKYIVFESDDWGSERIPSKSAMSQLISSEIGLNNNPFNYLDSLESENDLTILFETLKKFKDKRGNHPVITANSVVANPDFSRIEESRFREYYYESIIDTYNKKEICKNSFSLIKEGMDRRIFQPQFHGREHLSVKQWLSGLKSGNKILLKAFKAGIFGIDLDIEHTNRDNFMAAFDLDSPEDLNEHEKIIEEGTHHFEQMFGFQSKSFIAPCYVWHPAHESILNKYGIRYIQGIPVQHVPDARKKYRKVWHYQGQKNRLGQRYFVRNCFFEPSLNPGFNWIEDCLRRLDIIFYWGKPAIIGTHRINFIGSLMEDNRKKNIRLFESLIGAILKKWPDVEFTTTDKLGDTYLKQEVK